MKCPFEMHEIVIQETRINDVLYLERFAKFINEQRKAYWFQLDHRDSLEKIPVLKTNFPIENIETKEGIKTIIYKRI